MPPAPTRLTEPTPGWLAAEVDRLLDGARAARASAGGFGWLDADGRLDPTRPRQLWITARMTHCFALGLLRGREADAVLVDHGLAALGGGFADAEHGGWYDAVGDHGPLPGPKGAYGHAFVLLAASSATVARRPGAADLLRTAAAVVLEHFWDDAAGAMVEEWDRAWSSADPYRGANANMHSVEAFLAVAGASRDAGWLDRALRIADRIINGGARAHDWRVPEHFGPDWTELPEYNADAPAHPFRPYGVTPGHGLEWSRLMVTLALARERAGRPVPGWLMESARRLFDRAVGDGWDAARGGFPYTTDWQGRPVVTERFHWVACEAIAAAWALHAATGETGYADLWARFWAFARATYLDGRPGWLHEADAQGRPTSITWTGRPDVYHALQAALISQLPPAPSFAEALASAKEASADAASADETDPRPRWSRSVAAVSPAPCGHPAAPAGGPHR
ncbi:MAG TPA: AGE family epimerase/isomerase [Kineosporiaceae bacterium]